MTDTTEIAVREQPLTLDSAFERLQDEKDERAVTQQPAKQPAQEPSTPPAKPEMRWSPEDAETVQLLQSEAQRFQHDLQRFVEAQRSVDINEVEKRDKSEAEALRTQLRDAERELRERHEVITQASREIADQLHGSARKQAEAFIDQQRAYLAETLPDLDKSALRDYLADKGFTEQEIEHAHDARLVELAEKARRYDAMSYDEQPKGKTPTRKRKASKPDPELEGARERARAGHLDRRDATTLVKSARKSKPKKATVSELSARLRKSGRLDDAYALLQAKREA